MKAVVVGGSSGIGEATARLFLGQGAEVVIAGRDPSRLEGAATRLGKVDSVVADATSAESVKRLFEAVGRFDHLVLAMSGARGGGPIAGISVADIRAGMDAKLFAQLTTLQAALPYVKGSITLVSAATAAAAMAGTSGLAAINGAVEALVRPLAAELAPLRINAVRPGVIDTPWWTKGTGRVQERSVCPSSPDTPGEARGRSRRCRRGDLDGRDERFRYRHGG